MKQFVEQFLWLIFARLCPIPCWDTLHITFLIWCNFQSFFPCITWSVQKWQVIYTCQTKKDFHRGYFDSRPSCISVNMVCYLTTTLLC